MTVYGYVQKGIHHWGGVCQDTVMLGNLVMGTGSTGVTLPDDFDFMLGVADGVGGVRGGDVASGLVMSALSRMDCGSQSAEDVCTMLFRVNALIREIGRKSMECYSMATTFVGFHMHRGEASVIWAGNSRLYQVTEENVEQLTVDHNQMNDWMASGQTGSGRGDALTVYLGMAEGRLEARLEREPIYLPGTKRIFLTSDGVHDHIPEDVLRELFLSDGNEEELPAKIAEAALQCGSTDDISVVMLVL